MATGGLRARSRAALASGATLAAFRVPGYPALWWSSALNSFGWSASLVAVGWITLAVSDSALAVGATFAARLLPALLLGIPLGSIVDRFDRHATLVVVNVVGTASLLGVAGLAVAGHLGLLELLVLSLGLGIQDTVRGTAGQSYAFDLAGPQGATNAIALGNLAGHLAGTVGSVAGGVVLERIGLGGPFLLAAVLAGAAAGVLLVNGRRVAHAPATRRLVPSFARSMTLIVRNRLVALIALVVIVNEVLGFSSITVMPTFARDILHTDAAGLGALTAVRSVGSIVGLLLVARLGFQGRGGALFLLATLGSGLALVAFALSTSFELSLLLLGVVGISWAVLDTLGQSLIQQAVEDSERGAAMGIWFFAIGFGPFGHVALGAAATAVGGPLALVVDGAILAAIAVALVSVRAIRRL